MYLYCIANRYDRTTIRYVESARSVISFRDSWLRFVKNWTYWIVPLMNLTQFIDMLVWLITFVGKSQICFQIWQSAHQRISSPCLVLPLFQNFLQSFSKHINEFSPYAEASSTHHASITKMCPVALLKNEEISLAIALLLKFSIKCFEKVASQ